MDADDNPPMTHAPRTQLEYIEAVMEPLYEIPAKYRLIVLQMAWLGTFSEALSDALAFPGGLEEERTRQLRMLTGLVAKTASHETDLEWEKLMAEEDWEGLDEYLKRKFGPKS